jgi:hypothetical protein
LLLLLLLLLLPLPPPPLPPPPPSSSSLEVLYFKRHNVSVNALNEKAIQNLRSDV